MFVHWVKRLAGMVALFLMAAYRNKQAGEMHNT